MNRVEGMYINSLAFVIVKGGENECFRIDNGVKQGCIISPKLFNGVINKVVKMGMGSIMVKFSKEEREWRLPHFCMQMT